MDHADPARGFNDSTIQPTAAELKAMSGLQVLGSMQRCHGAIAWSHPQVSEFAAVSLVMELPQALLALLRSVLELPALRENPRS
ncbi:MAG: hypothetical protein ACODUE_01795 [Synechococcus sp.]